MYFYYFWMDETWASFSNLLQASFNAIPRERNVKQRHLLHADVRLIFGTYLMA